MHRLNLNKVEDSKILQNVHHFGNFEDEQTSIFCVKMWSAGKKGSDLTALDVDVAFDVIEVELPFLVGLPSLLEKGTTLKDTYLMLALSANGKYHRFQLVLGNDHLYLHFEPHTVFSSNKGQDS